MRPKIGRILATIAALFYLVFATGVPVFAHYCGDQLVESRISTQPTKSCCAKKAKPCCKHQGKLLKAGEASHVKKAGLPLIIDFVPTPAPTLPPFGLDVISSGPEKRAPKPLRAPPQPAPLYLMGCSLRVAPC